MWAANVEEETDRISPDIDVLLGVLGGGELHDVLDELEGLVVHVVGVRLVPHVLSAAAGHAEEHDRLRGQKVSYRYGEVKLVYMTKAFCLMRQQNISCEFG